MSIEIYVLSDRRLDELSVWQEAIDLEGFSLVLDNSRAIECLSGYLPATWRGEAAGFECDHWLPYDLDEDPVVSAGPKRRYALAFRWGANLMASLGAYSAAAAYARATDGVVYDPEAEEMLSPKAAVDVAKGIERDLPAMKAMLAEVVRKFSKHE